MTKSEEVISLIVHNQANDLPPLTGIRSIYHLRRIPAYKTWGRPSRFRYINDRSLFGTVDGKKLALNTKFKWETYTSHLDSSILLINEDIQSIRYIILSKIDLRFDSMVALSTGNTEIIRLLLNDERIEIDITCYRCLIEYMLCEFETYRHTKSQKLFNAFVKQVDILNWIQLNYDFMKLPVEGYYDPIENTDDMLKCILHFSDKLGLVAPYGMGPCFPIEFIVRFLLYNYWDNKMLGGILDAHADDPVKLKEIRDAAQQRWIKDHQYLNM